MEEIKIIELYEKHRSLKNEIIKVLEELHSYFYIINLCNSSDHYKHFIKENPDWKYKNYCKILNKSETYLTDVEFKIPKYIISKEDFLLEARKIVNPFVGNEDFDTFEWQNKYGKIN